MTSLRNILGDWRPGHRSAGHLLRSSWWLIRTAQSCRSGAVHGAMLRRAAEPGPLSSSPIADCDRGQAS